MAEEVKETRELLKEGLDDVALLARKNASLDELMKQTAANVEQMEKLTNMIEGFAGVIAGIANKTNMLALNASIEAARAGEHGRGFAVVAKQVGELAAQSATSLKEIKETIQSVQGFTNEMVASMDQLAKAIEEQAQITTNVNRVLSDLKEMD